MPWKDKSEKREVLAGRRCGELQEVEPELGFEGWIGF